MEENNAVNSNRPVIVNAQYIKDLSFENPKAPMSLLSVKEQPKVDLSLNIQVQKLQDNTFEVALHINSKALNNQDLIFAVELVFAGLFTLNNLSPEVEEPTLLVYCPGLLFPFARSVLSNITRDAGFQPLMLDPIDFNALYEQRKVQQTTLN